MATEREVVYRLLLPGEEEPQEFRSGRGLTPHGLSLRLTSADGPLKGKNPDVLRFFVGEEEIPASTVIQRFIAERELGSPVIRVERG